MPRRGSTILELAVSIAIGALMFFILGAIFIAQGRYFAIEDATSETQYNAFQAIDTVGLFAGSATQVLSSRTIGGTDYTSGTSTLVLKMPSYDASGNVISLTYDYIAFGLDASDPTRFAYHLDAATGSQRLGGDFLKASLVDKLIFRYNTVDPADATAIDMYIRTSETVRGQTVTMPLGKVFYLGSI